MDIMRDDYPTCLHVRSFKQGIFGAGLTAQKDTKEYVKASFYTSERELYTEMLQRMSNEKNVLTDANAELVGERDMLIKVNHELFDKAAKLEQCNSNQANTIRNCLDEQQRLLDELANLAINLHHDNLESGRQIDVLRSALHQTNLDKDAILKDLHSVQKQLGQCSDAREELSLMLATRNMELGSKKREAEMLLADYKRTLREKMDAEEALAAGDKTRLMLFDENFKMRAAITSMDN
jgi:hypothetical protein